MKKSIYLFFLLGIVLIVIVYLVRSEFFRVLPSTDLLALSHRELRNSAIKAIERGDEPVSAIVLHNYSLIGRGYNTILSDTNAVGHAVINALNDAIKNKGWNEFNSLDKNSIIVMSTTEPCQLCKAALFEYGISKIEFMNYLPITYWLNSYWNDFAFSFRKRQLEPSDLQDSLIQIKASQQINYHPK
jgi:tRNA(Arg) A34 adenosine deaminase TadA